MIWKSLKVLAILLLLIVLALFAIPFFFQDQIKARITKAINEKVDATVSFTDADLSLFRNFPQASVNIEQLLIINKAPFAGDTLISLGTLNLKMSIKELFKAKEEAIDIESFSSQDGLINILFDKNGIGNFDIAIKDDPKDEATASAPLSLKIKEYTIQNLRFHYYDERSKVRMRVDSLNHSGTGDLAASKLDLVTKSTAKMSLDVDKTNYMNNVALSLDAILAIDLNDDTYTFKNNKALINNLPLEFDGAIQLVEQGQLYDLTFKTPTSDFQNFLGLLPSAYSGNLKDIKTTGDFTVAGFAKGLYSDSSVPQFNIRLASDNASFQYPDLPKSVQNIVIDTKIINESGILNDTYINVDKLSFRIDQDVFDTKANIKNITENPVVAAVVKGTINLANLSKAYPIKLDKPLSGILKADVTTGFDMESIRNNQYANIKNSGTMQLSGFKYTDEKGKAMNISSAAVSFDPSRVTLQKFIASTGRTDLSITGVLDNFYGFLFNDQELKGDFNLQSNQFAVSDFITSTSPNKAAAAKPEEAIKIPAFLNCSVTAKMNTILYDNLILKDASGTIRIKDEKLTLENIRTSIFGGQIIASGTVSTKTKVPVFNMTLNLNKVNIEQTFTQLEMMKNIAPIAGVVNGTLNSTIRLSGNLDATKMTPDLKSLTGDLIGQLLSTTISAENSQLLTALGSNIKFIDLKKLNLNDLKAALTFKDGKVNLKPIDLKYQDIKVNIAGQHGFDQSMLYNLKFDVPAKYLGTEANKLIAQLTPAEASKIENVPVSAMLTGNFKNPKITTDMKQAVNNLANQLVQYQKDRLIKQGTSALGNLLNNNKKDTTKTTTPKEDIKNQASDIINNLFNKKKKK